MSELRGAGRWDEALALVADPLARADLLNEQALFTGSADARAARRPRSSTAPRRCSRSAAGGSCTRACSSSAAPRIRASSRSFERALELARASATERLEAQALFWVGLVHQVVRGDHAAGAAALRALVRARA